jgi:hypothetical protein
MPTSQQGTAAFCARPPQGRRSGGRELGCSKRPRASGLAAGFFFFGRGNQFAAIRIALVRKTGILPRNVSSTLQPRLRPESGAFSFCVAAVSDSWSARRTRQRSRQGQGGPNPAASSCRTLPSQPSASARTLVRGRAGTAVFSVTSEWALGPFGKRLRRYVPRRIVRRRHLCASVKCRMDARH